jgi:hypothetical protein
MWDPRHLTALWASRAGYRDPFTFTTNTEEAFGGDHRYALTYSYLDSWLPASIEGVGIHLRRNRIFVFRICLSRLHIDFFSASLRGTGCLICYRGFLGLLRVRHQSCCLLGCMASSAVFPLDRILLNLFVSFLSRIKHEHKSFIIQNQANKTGFDLMNVYSCGIILFRPVNTHIM